MSNPKVYTIHVYEAKDGWRWHMKAANGRILDDSGQAYGTKEHARRAADAIAAAKIVVAK